MPYLHGWNQEWVARRLEDLAWMDETGESANGAARRLDTTPDGLERWLYRQGRSDLWRRLYARNPHDENYRSRGHQQAKAVAD